MAEEEGSLAMEGIRGAEAEAEAELGGGTALADGLSDGMSGQPV